MVGSRLDRYFGSFKTRLAAYFLLLALLPLLGAVWAFSEVATEGETKRADARLNAALRVAAGDFSNRVEQAAARAESLARVSRFGRPLGEGDRAELERLYGAVPNAAFYVRGRQVAGSPPRESSVRVRRFADVVDERGRRLGRAVVFVPLDRDLVARLRAQPGFEEVDALALVTEGRVIGGPAALADAPLPVDRADDVELAGETYRALGARLAAGENDATLVAFTPKARIEAQAADVRRRILLLAGGALLVAAAFAYGLGRTIVRSLKELSDAAGAIARGNLSSRVPTRGHDEFAALGRSFNEMARELESHLDELASERGRTRSAVSRFGEALAAAHNPLLLVPVIVESMVEATGAAGGRLVIRGQEIASTGDLQRGGEPLAIPLENEDEEAGLLLLTPPAGGFTGEARERARWLASQASAALQHAAVHKRLELEAITDLLTELPNRRQFQDSLDSELTRVERYGGDLALVIADLDDFKQVNDRFGHLAGDAVLREFASVLRESVREIDTSARYGGEEFALLLPGTDVEGAVRVAERIRVELAARRIAAAPGSSFAVTASFGVAAFPRAQTADALFSAADEALYRAKAGGKNRVETAGGTRPSGPAAVREA